MSVVRVLELIVRVIGDPDVVLGVDVGVVIGVFDEFFFGKIDGDVGWNRN